jgi:hypothetical protein
LTVTGKKQAILIDMHDKLSQEPNKKRRKQHHIEIFVEREIIPYMLRPNGHQSKKIFKNEVDKTLHKVIETQILNIKNL